MKKLAVALVLFTSAAAKAGDYKAAADAAYCAGAIQRTIELTKKTFGDALDMRSDEQSYALRLAFVEGALKQGKIDRETADKLLAIGHSDAQFCWDTAAKCSREWAKRDEQNMERERSQAMMETCERPAQSACKRTKGCQ
jgi:hypothetical protein